jgi:hypothetical protein
MILPKLWVCISLFADDTCLYATDRKEGYIVRKLQRVLDSGISKSIRTKLGRCTSPFPPESLLTLNGRNIPFVNNVKYLGVIFDKRITWRLHIEKAEAKALRTFIRIYTVLKVSD